MAEWLAVWVPGGCLWEQLIRPVTVAGMKDIQGGPESQLDLPLQRALVVLLPVLPGARGGPVARDFSALWTNRGLRTPTNAPWYSHTQGWRTCPEGPHAPVSCAPTWWPLLPRAPSPTPGTGLRMRTLPTSVWRLRRGTDAERLRHDVAERWPLCRLQAEQTQDELA